MCLILWAFLTWGIGLIWTGCIFEQNNIAPSILTILISAIPIVNITFAIVKTIFDIKNGKHNEEITKIIKLFKNDEQDE